VGSEMPICVERRSPRFARKGTICGLPILPHYSSISSFHRGPEGQLCRTKPICLRRLLTLTIVGKRTCERNRVTSSLEKQSQFGALRLLPPLSRGQACCAPRNDMRTPGPDEGALGRGGTGEKASVQNKANLALGQEMLTFGREGTYEINEQRMAAEKQSQFAPYGVTTSGAGVTCGGILVYWAAGWWVNKRT
jgi:hypothetical protein